MTIKHKYPKLGLRYLGVKQNLTGSDQAEYNHRHKEGKIPATQLNPTPLDWCEAYTVYLERFKSSFFYPLLVTQFSKTQCYNMQSTIYQQLINILPWRCSLTFTTLVVPIWQVCSTSITSSMWKGLYDVLEENALWYTV